ncbi:unnamed protein product [Spirodela intermedia]|uniref:DYW domain-containing protein n=1 Tax=Spirodela intermedia TaxID=51605 RepID=A0A7I8J2Q5_SPIIN|nr:unnamed protein product [Spirodela intermedia]CAA6664494.1 unnamed protein product [Spirodela intermedia]
MGQLEAALQRCSSFSHIRQLHGHLIAAGLFQTLPSTRCKLVELCAVSPFGELAHALATFRQISRPATNDWNAVLRGLARGTDPLAAVSLFAAMARLVGAARDDALTCSFVLQACGRANALRETAQLHGRILRRGFAADFRLQTTLVDAYAKGADVSAAAKVFDEMPQQDVPTWNALINGFAAGSRPHDAVALFRRMAASPACPPDVVTILGALSACAQLGDLVEGESVRAYAREAGLEGNVRVRNALMDMYAKCGSVGGAVEVFRGTAAGDRSLVSWNTVIMALALHGHGARALKLFEEMSAVAGVRPDAVTYLAVLSGCNHAGWEVARGLRGRRHHADPPDVILWQTLLGACKTYGDVPLAERVSGELLAMGSRGDGDYVLLSNVYAAAERWGDVGRVRAAMAEQDVRKVPGFSFIQHPRWREIQRTLEEVRGKVRTLGYAPETAGNVLHDVLEEDKEEALWQHSERLRRAEEIRVVKNLRICGDCHAVAKLVSRAYGCVVVVRDRARFPPLRTRELLLRRLW